MTRQEFIDKNKHYLAGIVMDAMHRSRGGEEAGLFARTAMVNIDNALGRAYDSLFPPNDPAATANGKATKPQVK